ncbi:hypothetical protein K438DRAFT_1981882 [Mycena galopus ATCC 62051]|nr:hypothetical protein K438DRAFT_1981882 [Mycena galopus ATCC 62051]
MPPPRAHASSAPPRFPPSARPAVTRSRFHDVTGPLPRPTACPTTLALIAQAHQRRSSPAVPDLPAPYTRIKGAHLLPRPPSPTSPPLTRKNQAPSDSESGRWGQESNTHRAGHPPTVQPARRVSGPPASLDRFFFSDAPFIFGIVPFRLTCCTDICASDGAAPSLTITLSPPSGRLRASRRFPDIRFHSGPTPLVFCSGFYGFRALLFLVASFTFTSHRAAPPPSSATVTGAFVPRLRASNRFRPRLFLLSRHRAGPPLSVAPCQPPGSLPECAPASARASSKQSLT